MEKEKMKVAYYEVGKDMVVKEIDSIGDMQILVDGNIKIMGHDKIKGFLYIVNEDGDALPSRYKPSRKIYNGGYTIMGNFFVAKYKNLQIVGLDDEDIYKLMAADMTVEQMIEMDRLYRELCRENNYLKEVIKKSRKTLEEGYVKSRELESAMRTITAAIGLMSEEEKENER